MFLSGNQTSYALYLEKNHGHGILQELAVLKNDTRAWTIDELNEIHDKYKELNKLYGKFDS